MAENAFKSNVRDPRYSTNRALGFQGGSSGPTGNIVPPTATSVAGTSDKGLAGTPEPAAGLSSFSATPLPKPPGVAQSLVGSLGSAAVGEAGKAGINAVFGPGSTAKGVPAGADEGKSFSEIGADDAMDIGSGPDAVDNFDDTAYFSEGLSAAGDAAGSAAADGFAGWATDEAAGAIGEEVAGGFIGDAVGDFAGEAIPYVGSVIDLAQGNYGSAVGSAIGTAILPGIGTAVGGFIGGLVDKNCFITEAVMSAGGQDNGQELETLRWFRDTILMRTPQGQAMIQEYEQIAPVVVEAIGARPDAMQIFQGLKAQFIDPSVAEVMAGNYKGALEIYAKMIAYVTPFASEMMQDQQMAGEVEAMGDHAAMLTHDDMSTAGIAAGGPGAADWMPADAGNDMGGIPAAPQMNPMQQAPQGGGIGDIYAQEQPQRRHY